LKKTIDPFFQLSNKPIIQQLQQDFSQLSATPSEKEVFICVIIGKESPFYAAFYYLLIFNTL